MRTRIFNKMKAQEVQDYLDRGGDTMFVGIGVVEVHGDCPIDCETAVPEAVAIAMAEEADGLAMINLPYFYPGGTVISNSTVHITIRDGIDYLMKIARSLVDQGFRRLYFVSGHGPSAITINAFCHEFFEETLIHPCHVGLINALVHAHGPQSVSFSADASGIDYMTYGAYKMLGQLDYIPIDPNATNDRGERIPTNPSMSKFMKLYSPYSGYGATAQIFSDPRQHGGGFIFKSREELEDAAAKGITEICELVSKMNLKELNDALREYQAYVQRMAEKFPRIMRR
jgi:creatinine amidohydrolase